jgi:predicted dehydrogenase
MDPNFLYFYDATDKSGALGGECGYKAIECVGRFPAPGGTFPAPKAPTDWLRGHVGGVYSFLNSVVTGIPSAPTFADGAHVQKIMEAAYLSSQKHCEVSL